MAAVAAFGEGEPGVFSCPGCGYDSALIDWKTEDVTGGCLGLQFWNWWPLTDAFKTERHRLTGSEIFLIRGML